jgi:hypothetical protein
MQPPATDPPAAGGADEPLVAVYLTNGTRTSAGPGPGVKRLPPAEAGALVRARLAAYGERPPRGYADGGMDGLAPALMMPQGG